MDFIKNIWNSPKKGYSAELSPLIVTDLDEFFFDCHSYYKMKGTKLFTASILSEVLSKLFLLGFFALMLAIDWQSIVAQCQSNHCNLVTELWEAIEAPSVFVSLVYLILLLFAVQLVRSKFAEFLRVRAMKEVFHSRLKLRRKDLENLEFSDVVQKLITLQENDNYCRVKDTLTPFDIISRINRKSNYAKTILSRNVFSTRFMGFDCLSPYTLTKLTKLLGNTMFSKGNACIEESFSKTNLRLVLLVEAVKETIFLIPNLVLNILLWLTQNADHIKEKTDLFEPELKTRKILELKCLNESDDHFSNRMWRLQEKAFTFKDLFSERRFTVASKIVIVCCGAVLLVIVGLSLLDEGLLVNMHLGGTNLLVAAIGLGTAMSVSRQLDRHAVINFYPPEYKNLFEYKESLFKEIVEEMINVEPSLATSRSYSKKFKILSAYFITSAEGLAREALSILIYPLLLVQGLYSVGRVVGFVKNNTVRVEGLGDIVSYAVTDPTAVREFKANMLCEDKSFVNSLLIYEKQWKKDSRIKEKVQKAVQNVLTRKEEEFDAGKLFYHLNLDVDSVELSL